MMIKQLLLFGFLLISTSKAITQTEAELDSIAMELDFSEVVVTAQYAPTHSKNAVHQVKVIRAIDIQEQGQNNLAEVLNNQLNLRVNTDPILGNGLKIQGIGGENIQIMMDGVPIIGRVDGNIDLSQINLNNIDRIEIIEGAMSAQYGSNASGGVINIISKKSQLKKFQFESQNQYESIGILNNSVSVGLQTGKLYTNLNASRYNSQFAPDDSLRIYESIELADGSTSRSKVTPWNPKTQYSFEGTLRYQFSDSTSVRYQYRDFEETLRVLGEVRRPQFRPYIFDEYYTTQRQDHFINIESYINSRFYINSTTAYNQYAREKKTERLDIEPDTTSLVPGGQDTTEFSSFLHRTVFSTISKKKLNAQLGLEILRETGSGGRIIDSTTTPYNKAIIENYATWLSFQYQPITEITLQTNLRYGYNSKYDHPLIPSFHANWKPNANWALKASYARGFRAPSLKELHFNFIDINHNIIGNPDLRAEKAQNVSLNLERQWLLSNQQQVSVNAKLFFNSIKDRIVLAEHAPLQFNYQNIDQFETHGFNIQAQYHKGNDFKLQSGLAYTRLYNFWSEEFETDKFTALPEMQNELHFTIPIIQTKAIITHRYIGQQIRFYQNSDNNLEEGFIGDYHFLNLSFSKKIWKTRIHLTGGIKNLLDTQTVPVSGASTGGTHSNSGSALLLNWGRTYFVRLNIRL